MADLSTKQVAKLLGVSVASLHCARTTPARLTPIARLAHRKRGRLFWDSIELEAALLQQPHLRRRCNAGRPRKASAA